VKHDAFSRHEDDARDLIEALGKLSRDTPASPGFSTRIMAQAEQLPTPRRGALGWLSKLPLWPASPGWQVAAAAFCLIVMIGAVSQYVTWIRAGLMGVPSGLLHEAQLQEQLWQKNFECATQLTQQSTNYAAIAGEHVTVVTWACPSGDVLVTLESLTESEDVSRRSVWVPLDAPPKTARFFDHVVGSPAFAAQRLQLAQRSNPVTRVICQKRMHNKLVKRRVQRADGKCEDEWIKVTNGSVVQRQPAPCNPGC
jgi:hypothetical protein